MLNVINLAFEYADTPLLRAVNFSLTSGGLLHLRGDNGAGKTTLLKLLAGVLHPTEGEIRYNGHSIEQNLADYQHNICYVGHKSGISQLLTVRENCYFELQRFRVTKNPVSIDTLLQRFSLTHVCDVPCNLLSAGLRRRVGLLRLAMSNASLWLLDEPLVALDQDSLAMMMTNMTEHLQKGGQIVLTSHQQLPLFEKNYQEYYL